MKQYKIIFITKIYFPLKKSIQVYKKMIDYILDIHKKNNILDLEIYQYNVIIEHKY